MLKMTPLVCLAVLAGCYHATVETGRPPSPETVSKPWAHSFIGGLVPPGVVETAQKCPNGVAKVETKLSFLNMLVGGLTFGIYTPMTITATCAARASADNTPTVRASDVGGDPADLIEQAAQLSQQLATPVLIEFD